MSSSKSWIEEFLQAEWHATEAKFTSKDNFAFMKQLKALVAQVEGDSQWLDARKDRTMFPPAAFWETAEEKLAKRRRRTLFVVSEHPHDSAEGLVSGWVSSNNTQLDDEIYQRIHTALVSGARKVIGVDTLCPGCGGDGTSCSECGGSGWVARVGVDVRGAGTPTSVEVVREPSDERSKTLLAKLRGEVRV